jgi:hypothetical protein
MRPYTVHAPGSAQYSHLHQIGIICTTKYGQLGIQKRAQISNKLIFISVIKLKGLTTSLNILEFRETSFAPHSKSGSIKKKGCPANTLFEYFWKI